MKLYPLFVLCLHQLSILAQNSIVTSVNSAMHYPGQCFFLNEAGSTIQFPAIGIDSSKFCVLLSNQLNGFDPGIQNQSVAFLKKLNSLFYKFGVAQFGNSHYRQQSVLLGLQLKLIDKANLGCEFQLAQSNIEGYQTNLFMGLAIGFGIALTNHVQYQNRIGYQLKQTPQSFGEINFEYNHLLLLSPIKLLNVYGSLTKNYELHNAYFSIGSQLELSPFLNCAINFRPAQQHITLGIGTRIKKLQVVMECKMSHATGLGYFLSLSQSFSKIERKILR